MLRDSEIPVPPRCWWLRRLTGAGAILAIALLALHFAYAHHAANRYAAVVADLTRRGEPTRPSDFDDPKITAEGNAVEDIRAAVKALDDAQVNDDEWTLLDHDWPDLKLKTGEVAPIAAVMQRVRLPFAAIRNGRSRTWINWQITWPTDGDLNRVDFGIFGSYRNLAMLENAAAAYQHTMGHDHEAIEHVRDLYLLARVVDQQQVMIPYLVAGAIESLGNRTLNEITPTLSVGTGPNQASMAEVREVIGFLLNDAPRMELYRRLTIAERAFGAVSVKSMSPSPITQPFLDLQAVRLIEAMRLSVDLTSESRFPKAEAISKVKALTKPADTIRNVIWRHSIIDMSRMPLIEFRMRGNRRLLAAKLAIAAYRTEHGGSLPAKLDDLAPKYLPRLPVDPFSATGDVIKYRPDLPRPCVYSVSENGNDDGANHAATQPGENNWTQPDAVMPLDSPGD